MAQKSSQSVYSSSRRLPTLGGAIGMSPHPQHWFRFTSQYGSQMRTCPPGFICSDSNIWEPWWLHYTTKARIFTLYLAHALTMATQHREKGVHEKAKETKKDFDFIRDWENRWERHTLPKNIPRFNLNLVQVSDVLQEAHKIHDKYNMVIITILGDDNIPTYYDHLTPLERDKLFDKTLFIVQYTLLHFHGQHLPYLPHLAIDRERPASNQTDDQLLQIIAALTQQEIRVITLPSSWRGSPEDIQHMVGPTLRAGRGTGQTSPSIDFMVWDARVEMVYRFIQRWKNMVMMTGKFIEFKQAWLKDVERGYSMQWDWLPSN